MSISFNVSDCAMLPLHSLAFASKNFERKKVYNDLINRTKNCLENIAKSMSALRVAKGDGWSETNVPLFEVTVKNVLHREGIFSLLCVGISFTKTSKAFGHSFIHRTMQHIYQAPEHKKDFIVSFVSVEDLKEVEFRIKNLLNRVIKEFMASLTNPITSKSPLVEFIPESSDDGKMLFSLNFRRSPLDWMEAQNLLFRIRQLSANEGLFSIVKVYLNLEDRLNFIARSINPQLALTLFQYTIIETEPSLISLDFLDSPLHVDQIQKVLWDIITTEGHEKLFVISELNFDAHINYADLTNPERPNNSYTDIDLTVLSGYLESNFGIQKEEEKDVYTSDRS